MAPHHGLKTLEVRCCCDAGKVLGYLEHPRLQELGDRCRFPMNDWSFTVPKDATSVDQIRPREIELEVDYVILADYARSGPPRLAIKNRDYPIEDLKRIPGFVEKDHQTKGAPP